MRSWTRCLVAVVALSGPFGEVAAQGVRITGATWVQSIDLRPWREDSLPASDVPGEGTTRTTADGKLVQCPVDASFCYYNTSGIRERTTPLLQDLTFAAWGLGRGISAHAHVRARSSLGGADLWPRMGDRFDALDAYVEIDRPSGRARLGRVWAYSGLGTYNFDGGSLLLRRGVQSLEVYGGRALVQGLNDSYTTKLIGAVDDIPPEDDGILVGVRVRTRPSDLSSVSAVYQRIVYRDRSALLSERAGLDASMSIRNTTIDASLAYDVTGRALNVARVRAARLLPLHLEGTVEARRRRPFFETWTIWGAFAPVGFDEGRAEVAWRAPSDMWQVSGHGAYRVYAEDHTGVDYLPLRSDGWRTGVDASWLPSQRFAATVSYSADLGFGASRTDASVGARWTPTPRWALGASATDFQTIYEFRVGTGRVLGVTLDGSVRVSEDVRLVADGTVFHHRLSSDAPGTDWSQRRASVRLEWALGGDPGLARGAGR
ncbi:MAG: hypothetical protein IT359_07300 [Gemmatimonadaceae bacterium]|nr:hypothetical protein [Gemmatimonadaceae bacterium]